MSSPDEIDLSRDEDEPTSLPRVIRAEQASAGVEEWQHQRDQQRTVVNAALSFVALLYLTSIVVVLIVVLVGGTETLKHDGSWKLAALTSGFLLAATVIMIVLIRAVHPAVKPDESPSAETLKTSADAIKSILEPIAGVFKKPES